MSRATEYIILSGLLALSGIARAGDIRIKGQFVSEKVGGPPLVVNSTDKVIGLNADRLDGMTSADFATVNELATPDSGTSVHYKNVSGIPGVEINQDCAINTGCGSADSPGFPVSIVSRGSYRLTSNLTTNDKDTFLIVVSESGVTLDLNGFALQGPVTCTGSGGSLSCSPTDGSGAGVAVASNLTHNVSVHNGTIKGMGGNGLFCGSHCRITGITSSLNGGNGIAISEGAVLDSVAERNFMVGITGSGIFKNTRSRGNKAEGFNLESDGLIINSVARGNGATGITGSTDSAATIKDSLAVANSGNGIAAGPGSVVTGNSARENGNIGILVFQGTVKNNSAIDNSGSGYQCGGCMLLDNTSLLNGGSGIEFVGSSYAAYGRNFINGNSGSAIGGGASNMGGNICSGSSC